MFHSTYSKVKPRVKVVAKVKNNNDQLDNKQIMGLISWDHINKSSNAYLERQNAIQQNAMLINQSSMGVMRSSSALAESSGIYGLCAADGLRSVFQ